MPVAKKYIVHFIWTDKHRMPPSGYTVNAKEKAAMLKEYKQENVVSLPRPIGNREVHYRCADIAQLEFEEVLPKAEPVPMSSFGQSDESIEHEVRIEDVLGEDADKEAVVT